MSKYLHLLLMLTVTGCSGAFQVKTFSEQASSTEEANAAGPRQAPSSSDELRPVRSVEQLLLQRLRICAAAEAQRETLAKQLSVTPNAENGVNEAQLDLLLLASCSPATKPGVMNQLLADLTALGTWPEAYAAFFDLLISGQRAYAAVEKVYLEVKQEHEKTIEGLSEIETQIEKQTATQQAPE